MDEEQDKCHWHLDRRGDGVNGLGKGEERVSLT